MEVAVALGSTVQEPLKALERWSEYRRGGTEMWLALAPVVLAAAIGFNVLALVIQDEQ